MTFTTLNPPTVTTQSASNVGTTSATGNGNITDVGTTNPTAHGVCWSTTANPTVADSSVDNGPASATGAFTANITGLSPGNTYHVRAYATNNAGTGYGEDVTFTTTPVYSLVYTAGVHGSITGTSPQTVSHGSSGSPVTAVSDTGYFFKKWSDNSTTNPRTDTNVTGNIMVTAEFEAYPYNEYILSYTAGVHGSISGNTYQTVGEGYNGTAVIPVPDTGYRFVNWSDGSTANPRQDEHVTANVSVTAFFSLKQYTVTYTAGAYGTITGTSPQTVNYGASGSAITAVPAAGYRFVSWSDGSTANPRTDTNVTANITVTANFAIIQYTLTYTAGANGSITGTSPQTVNYGANGSAVTAVPETGYQFVSWSDGSIANPRTDTNVTSDITVTADFTRKQCSISASAGTGGTISPNGSVTVNYGADQTFTITPDSGCKVNEVLVDGEKITTIPDTGGTYTFTDVRDTHTISARFTATVKVLGACSDGVWIWDDTAQTWSLIPSTADISMIATGNIDGDSFDDLIAVQPSGLYVRLSVTGQWVKLTEKLPNWITAGDMNDDGLDDVIGSWINGVYYMDSATGRWSWLSSAAKQIAAGNIGGTRDDLVWANDDNDLWVRLSSDTSWRQIESYLPIYWITTGNMAGDSRADIIGSYTNGTWYWNSATDVWSKITVPAEQVAAGDIDGDGRDDLVGVWPSGVWIKYSATGLWRKISATRPQWITTGRIAVERDSSGTPDRFEAENIAELSVEGPGGVASDTLDRENTSPH